ncbi:restriction endonuclease subunit S [Streptococcus thermophilus]|uniref:restriction endonuclease subunit S n=1 Tax=Streptococcus thermophilus TaxID=1308 RepID=UPI0021A59401|nr:restriction endonuclease subunit S [Streptococcus thermophilus]
MKNHKEQFPKIRFKDNIIHTYCDEWRQHKLGEVFEQTVEYVDPYEQNLELWSVTVESGLTPKEERYNREFLVKKSDKFKKLYPEEIVYNPMNITIGAVGFNNVGKEVAVSGYYVTMKIKSKFSNKFFSVWLSCPKAISLYKIYSTGSLIERQRVQFPTLSEIRASFPSFTEQSVIGSLFRTLDDLLSSYKNNLANYQSLKATMLSKMFPKAGHTVPEIRLDGFEGDWELLEINDLADDFQSGGTPKTNVQEYWNGNIPWIQSSDLETNCLFETKVQKSISEKGLKNSSAKIIPKDSIAVVTRVGVGKLAVMRHEYATSQDFLSFSNLKSNIEFTAYLLYRLLQKEVTQLQGTSIKGITKVELLSKKVLIPSLPEQQAIGAYFSNLDNLINSYQEKISQLETLKKKFLQDMFI